MIVKYGPYTHDNNEVAVTITRQAQYGDNGQKTGFLETWTLNGFLHGDDQADLTSKINLLESSYAKDGQNLGIYTLAGAATAHAIVAKQAQYVRSNGITYPVGTGPEYTTYRTYTATIEAFFAVTANGNGPAPGSPGDLIDFTETVAYQGNGQPIRVFVPVISGPWSEQMTNTHSPIIITQTGSAIGLTGRPPCNPPLFPDRMLNPPSDFKFDRTTPKVWQPVQQQFSTSWAYVFSFMGDAPDAFPSIPQ